MYFSETDSHKLSKCIQIFYILGPEESVEVDESLFDDLDLDADEFESDSEDASWHKSAWSNSYNNSTELWRNYKESQ